MDLGSATRDLAPLLAHRRWASRDLPFGHVVARDVFTDDAYAALAEDFHRVMGTGAVDRDSASGYTAKWNYLADHADGPLGVFLSRGWHDLIAGVMGLGSATGDVAAALHHHRPGGTPGWPHNDLNPGWFGGPPPGPGEVRTERVDGVDYNRGGGSGARQTIRAVSVLFYLGNPPWSDGDGGETALYAGFEAAQRGEATLVPPVNNSMVAFECTPYSWHAFAGQARHERNCLVMWLHRPVEEVVEQWGEQSIVQW